MNEIICGINRWHEQTRQQWSFIQKSLNSLRLGRSVVDIGFRILCSCSVRNIPLNFLVVAFPVNKIRCGFLFFFFSLSKQRIELVHPSSLLSFGNKRMYQVSKFLIDSRWINYNHKYCVKNIWKVYDVEINDNKTYFRSLINYSFYSKEAMGK